MASSANSGETYVRSARSAYLLILLSLIWGSSFLLIKVSVETVPPFTAGAGRAVLAAIFLHLWLRLRGERMPPMGRAWLPFLALGIASIAVPFAPNRLERAARRQWPRCDLDRPDALVHGVTATVGGA